jgi:hypothetical protein
VRLDAVSILYQSRASDAKNPSISVLFALLLRSLHFNGVPLDIAAIFQIKCSNRESLQRWTYEFSKKSIKYL